MNKRTALFFICLMLFLNYNCTTTCYNNNSGVIKFENHIHDFGEVAYKENCEYSFNYSNHGNVPIVIQDVETSCGCTVPDWPKNPLKPGKSEELKITYDTSQPGVFRKTMTVHYNGKDSPVKLSISGNVSYPENNNQAGNVKIKY